MASDLVLIPVQPSPYDVWASAEIVQLVREAQQFKEKLKSAFSRHSDRVGCDGGS
jgi:chromosome partitioning protein